MNIPLARPDITDLERQYVMEVLSTDYLSLGPKLTQFEERLAEWAGVKHAIAVNSGTSALHLIISALGMGRGDEVITSPFSFVASANCILFEKGTPVFADIDPKTLNIDPAKVEEVITERTKAILAVDVFGQPADWDALQTIAKRHNLHLIEDSAEAIGSEYKGHLAGGLGDAGIFSFYPNKQITTGEGGAVLSNDEDVSSFCRSVRNQGRAEKAEWLEHERLGYNFRISDINCALGLAQLERLPEIMDARSRVAEMYNQRLKDVKGIDIPYVAPEVKMSWFVYVAQLSEGYQQAHRDHVIQALHREGIGCRAYFPTIHLSPFYRQMFGFEEGSFPTAESASARAIALPFHNRLSEQEVNQVASALEKALASFASTVSIS